MFELYALRLIVQLCETTATSICYIFADNFAGNAIVLKTCSCDIVGKTFWIIY